MRSSALLVSLIFWTAPLLAAPEPDCGPDLAIISIHEIQKKLSASKILEQEDLLPGGTMPRVSKSASDVVFVRKSKEEGLKELRKAVDFPEERSWIYIPRIRIWIYTALQTADRNSVLVNKLIREKAIEAWGSVDDFHTHPWASLDGNRTAKDIGLDRGYSKEMLALVYLARPSVIDDLLLLKSAFDKRFSISRPEYDAYIIHPFGVTYYNRTWVVHNQPDGSKTAVYAEGLIWNEEDLKRAKKNGSPVSALREMIDTQVKRAEQKTAELMKSLGIPKNQWPRLTVRFEPWAD